MSINRQVQGKDSGGGDQGGKQLGLVCSEIDSGICCDSDDRLLIYMVREDSIPFTRSTSPHSKQQAVLPAQA